MLVVCLVPGGDLFKFNSSIAKLISVKPKIARLDQFTKGAGLSGTAV
jgi:hypothetical protein